MWMWVAIRMGWRGRVLWRSDEGDRKRQRERRNAGVSPLRFAPVEMTFL
jgi:hypothetical protein